VPEKTQRHFSQSEGNSGTLLRAESIKYNRRDFQILYSSGMRTAIINLNWFF
jgi:hypothetical protein